MNLSSTSFGHIICFLLDQLRLQALAAYIDISDDYVTEEKVSLSAKRSALQTSGDVGCPAASENLTNRASVTAQRSDQGDSPYRVKPCQCQPSAPVYSAWGVQIKSLRWLIFRFEG